MPRVTKKSKRTPIESHRHNDRRANIPTEELRGFVVEAEGKPPTMLYPRDPSLDPQLVWKGKDEQDQRDLAVPVVPIYIQEKVHPQAIIEEFVAQSRRVAGNTFGEEPVAYQLNLFADFNGLEEDFSRKVDFYSHDDGSRPHWSNRLILGDSLLAMSSLAEKEGLKGQVQMIYLDPPYGIKFGSNWQVSTRKRDVKDGRVGDMTRQPEQIRAFRDTWKLGIHSYLSYLRDRLVVARELLTETGSIFVQIGDENVHLVRNIMDEVFGSENFCSLVTIKKTSASTTDLLFSVNDYLLWYSKNRQSVKYRPLFKERELGGEGTGEYRQVMLTNGKTRNLTKEEFFAISPLPENAKVFRPDNLTSSHEYSEGKKAFSYEGRRFFPGNRYWTSSPIGMRRLAFASRLIARKNDLAYRRYLDDFKLIPINNTWDDTILSSRSEDKLYVVQTSIKVIQRCLFMTTDPGDLVLDPTCGSGTTAYVAEQWGRRWITMDTSRVALALARTRLMAARFPYYHLADEHPDLPPTATDSEIKAYFRNSVSERNRDSSDIKRGFVYRRVPHITLKSIANNPEIDEIHAKWQPQLEALRSEINGLSGKEWEEWEIPRVEDLAGWQPPVAQNLRGLVARWWELRRQRQAEIDEAIARHADTEILYDQPYEDNKRLRVAGPFTVESLSPHRMLSADGANGEKSVANESSDFATMILDNLRKAGVQNTKKGERLKFERLDTYPGRWLQAAGDYTDVDGQTRRVALSLGPEHGTVSPQQVQEAAKEAVRGLGFDLLLICGFAFDPHVNEEATRYGRLTVLPVKMNPDLAMGDELLKKTGAGNLFMVFGEPDLEVKTDGDGRVTVELLGLDIFDPTTGEIRSSSTDDIACWFIDTNYNEESFFVRHAYFTGADEPYQKLQRALRTEVDEDAWAMLYSTCSRPFERPSTGKFAVKVINHYGDEVLKVIPVK